MRDTYDGLKKLVTQYFKRGASIAALEEDPSSQEAKKALETALAKADASRDPEVLGLALERAKELSRMLERAVSLSQLEAIGVRIGELKAMNAQFGEIDLIGVGKGLQIEKATLEGDLIVDKVQVRGPN